MAVSWKPANLDRIQQLSSAASLASFGEIGYSQADLVARQREARENRLKEERLRAEREEREREERELREREGREEQRRLEERRREEERLEAARAREEQEAARPVAQVEVVEYSDDDIDDDFEVVDLDSFDVNDLVIVREDCISDSDGGEELLRGQRGEIVELDADGDAYIRFREHRKKQWVYSQNFGYLAKVLFDQGDAVNVRRSFECGDVAIRRGEQGRVLRVDAGGDVLIRFEEQELWVLYYCLVFLEKEKPKSSPVEAKEAKLWLYNPPSFRDVAIRATPSIDGPRTQLTMRPGQRFMVSEEVVGSDGVLYLKLADGSGWMFASKPGSGTFCVRQAGGMPKDLMQMSREQEDKILHVEDAKGLVISMDKVLASKPVQSVLQGLLQEPKRQGLSEVQKGQEMELVREKAKRILLDASKGVLKRFGFEVSPEGQQELLDALKEHEHDNTVYIVATNIEMALQIPAGGWFGLTQLRRSLQVKVTPAGPPELVGKLGVLQKFHVDAWQLRIGPEVVAVSPEHLEVVPDFTAHKELAKRRSQKGELREEEMESQARLMSGAAAAQRHLPSGRVPDKAPWWESCKDRARAKASSRMLEQEYLALASGSEEAFRETLKRERQVAPRAIEDEPLLPLPMLIEELEAAEVYDQVQKTFRSLARRSHPSSSSTRGRRRGAFSSRAGSLASEAEEAEDSDEARRAEASARQGDLRPILRQHKFACARKDATLQLMTGEDPELLALEDKNLELPARRTRAMCAPEEFERQRARWHLPPRGKHVGYMPQATPLGAGQGNLGALEDSRAPGELRGAPRAPRSPPPDAFGLPSFDSGPGFFRGPGL